LITRTNQLLERAAGVAAGLIEIADRVTPQRGQHRADPVEHVLGRAVVPAHGVAERVDVVDQLGRDVDLMDQRVAAVLVLRRLKGVFQFLHTGSEFADLAAHLVEFVG
jgi:hypothetical protein